MVGTGIPGKRWKLVGKRAEDREGHQGALKLTEVLHSSRTLLTYLPGSSSSEVLCKRGPLGLPVFGTLPGSAVGRRQGRKEVQLARYKCRASREAQWHQESTCH